MTKPWEEDWNARGRDLNGPGFTVNFSRTSLNGIMTARRRGKPRRLGAGPRARVA